MPQPTQHSDSVPCVVSIPCVQMLLLADDAPAYPTQWFSPLCGQHPLCPDAATRWWCPSLSNTVIQSPVWSASLVSRCCYSLMMPQPTQQTNSDSVPCVVSIPCVQMLLLADDAPAYPAQWFSPLCGQHPLCPDAATRWWRPSLPSRLTVIQSPVWSASLVSRCCYSLMMPQPTQQTNSDSVPCVVSIPCVQMLLLADDAPANLAD